MSSKKRGLPKGNPEKSEGDVGPVAAGYLVSCDIPTKQFILRLNDLRAKKFIIQDLGTHLLVKEKAKDEILKKVEEWEDSNVWSSIEKVGEDLDMS